MFEGKYLKEGVQLFENQKNNVRGLIHRRRALLSDKVGSGKTLSCLYAFAYLKEKGFLTNMVVFTPLNAYEKRVWEKDVNAFTKLSSISLDDFCKLIDNPVHPSHSCLVELLKRYDVIYGKHTHVENEDVLRLLKYILKSPTTLLIVDEVHVFKNPKTQKSKAMKELAKVTQNFWGITGSTLSKDLMDFYQIVQLIRPWYLGKLGEFKERWCIVRQKKIGWNPYLMKPRMVEEIVGLRNEVEFDRYMEPILIKGETFIEPQFDYIDYQLSDDEQYLYNKVSRGITLLKDELTDEDWIKQVLANPESDVVPKMKDVEQFSSRFIYLQSIVDGSLASDGTFTGHSGTKLDLLRDYIQDIIGKRQSVIVYFDYLASLDAAKVVLRDLDCTIVESSGRHTLKEGVVTEESCRQRPVVILGTRASSESVSYYYINNIILFDIPSVPHTFVQLVGRITRKNTLYPNDLHVYIFRSYNIDLYKLLLVSNKAYQLELVQGHEANIPDDYKKAMSKAEAKDYAKKVLLWLDKRKSQQLNDLLHPEDAEWQ